MQNTAIKLKQEEKCVFVWKRGENDICQIQPPLKIENYDLLQIQPWKTNL